MTTSRNLTQKFTASFVAMVTFGFFQSASAQTIDQFDTEIVSEPAPVGEFIRILGWAGPGPAPVVVNIPDQGPGGIPVRVIWEGAFEGGANGFDPTRIVIPNSVSEIQSRAFSGIPSLEEFEIGDGVLKIADDALLGSNLLEEITVDAFNPSFRAIDGILFSRSGRVLRIYPPNKAGENYGMPDAVEIIGNNAFANNQNLGFLLFNEGLLEIGTAAFINNQKLVSLQFPDSLLSIGDRAFFGSQNLVSLDFGLNLEVIGQEAFANPIGALFSATFFGNAPAISNQTFFGVAPGFEVRYFVDATGFDAPIWEQFDLKEIEAFGDFIFSSKSDGTLELLGYTGNFEEFEFSYDGELGKIEPDLVFLPAPGIIVPTEADFPLSPLDVNEGIIGLAQNTDTFYRSVFVRTAAGAVANVRWEAIDTTPELVSSRFRPGLVAAAQAGASGVAYYLRVRVSEEGEPGSMGDFINVTGKLPSELLGRSISGLGTGFLAGRMMPGLVLPRETVRIERNVFAGASGPTSMYIPSAVAFIGDGAFTNLQGATRLIVDQFNPFFVNESELEGPILTADRDILIAYPAGRIRFVVNLPDTVEEIRPLAFVGSQNILQLDLTSPALQIIGESAFSNVPNLASVEIGPNVEEIGDRAFASNSVMSQATFEGGAPLLFGENVFSGASSEFIVRYFQGAEGFTSPAWEPTPGQIYKTEILRRQGDFDFLILDNKIIIVNYTGVGPDVVVPATISGLPVRTIAARAFFSNRNVKTIRFPSGLTTIEEQAFYGSGLTEVAIPAGVNWIGAGAFGAAAELDSISVDENNPIYRSTGGILLNKAGTSIVQYPAGNMQSNLILSDGVETVEALAFAGSRHLALVEFPNTLVSIGEEAFLGSIALVRATFGSGLSSIGNKAFAFIGTLQSVTFRGNAPVNVGSEIFEGTATGFVVRYLAGATGFTNPWEGYPTEEITVQEGFSFDVVNQAAFITGYEGSDPSPTFPENLGALPVRGIAPNAFAGNTVLTNVVIPTGYQSIGAGAFSGSSSLQTIEIPSTITSIEPNAFTNTSALRTISVDPMNAFFNSASGILFNRQRTRLIHFPAQNALIEYTVPSTVTEILPNAFFGNRNLTKVTIGSRVTIIGDNAFASSSSLEIARFDGNAPVMGQGVFDGVPPDFQILFSAGSRGFTTPTWEGYPTQAVGSWRPGELATTSGFRALGIVEPTALNGDLGGEISFAVSRSGRLSGIITMGQPDGRAVRYRFLGEFNDNGQAAIIVPRRGMDPLEMFLELNMQFAPNFFTLTPNSRITENGVSAGLEASSIPWSFFNPATQFAGNYNVGLETDPQDLAMRVGNEPRVSEGYSFLYMTVIPQTGMARILGFLSDGSRFVGRSAVLADGTVPVWTQLYANRGALVGEMAIDSGPASKPVEAEFYWTKPAGMPRTTDRFGFQNVRLFGVPGSGLYFMENLNFPSDRVTLTFSASNWQSNPAGLTGGPFSQSFSVINNFRLIPDLPNNRAVRVAWNPRTGLLRGRFLDYDADGNVRVGRFQATTLSVGPTRIRGNFQLPNSPGRFDYFIGGSVSN